MAARDVRSQFGCSFGKAHVFLQWDESVGKKISWWVIMFTIETDSSGLAPF
jgi:hypothetical protein